MTTVEEVMEVYVNNDGEYVDSDDNKITFGDDVEKVIRIKIFLLWKCLMALNGFFVFSGEIEIHDQFPS